MSDLHFQVGDRVRVNRSTLFQAGRLGTVIQRFIGEDDLVDVQFDDTTCLYLMLISELEPADSTEEPELRERAVGS